MFKKILNVFLCLSLLLQNIAFAIPVLAEETNNPIIKVNGIYQGDEIASLDESDSYIIDKFAKVYLDFELENVSAGDDYYIKIDYYGGGSGFQYNNSNHIRENIRLYIMYKNDNLFDIDIKVCDDWNCSKIYASETVKLKLDYFDEIKDSYTIISDIKQGDKIINTTYENSVKIIHLNNKQNISYKITGKNLIDDADYYYKSGSYKGSELESGIIQTQLTNLGTHSSGLNQHTFLEDIDIMLPVKYYDGTNIYDYFTIEYEEDNTLPYYNYNLIYTNFENEEIKQFDLENRDNFYVINSNYHNVNNPLSLKVNGNNYADKDYLVSVKVKKGDTTIYNNSVNVNGLILNNGYKLELTNLTLELNKSILAGKIYDVYVEVDGVVIEQKYKYNSVGKNAHVSSNIFFENGKKNLSLFRGTGDDFFVGGIYDTNKNVFTKYSSVYIRYVGENFNDNESYEYILEYGDFEENTFDSTFNYEVELSKGQINGQKLNTTGLLFQVDNYKNYKNPTYKLTIKKVKR